MTINELKTKSHIIAIEKGFWEDYTRILEKMKKCEFSEDEVKIFKYSFINQKLLLIVSEIGECIEALRNDKLTRIDNDIMDELYKQSKENPKLFQMRFVHLIKDTFEDEISDVFIRLGDLCDGLGIDIEKHLDMKMTFNELRDKKHNKLF